MTTLNIVLRAATHAFVLRAARKFPATIVHGVEDKLFPTAFARENRDKYMREGHEANLLEVCNLGHFWAPNAGDDIWKFFAERPLPTKK